MFGFHVNREWAGGGRPTLAAQVGAARTFASQRLPGVPFAFQVFIAGPRQAKFTVDQAEARGLKEYLVAENAQGRPIWGVAHGTYVDVPWNGGARANPGFHKWIPKWIRKEHLRAAEAGLAGLVIHLGKSDADHVVSILPRLMPSPAETEAEGVADHPRWRGYPKIEGSCRLEDADADGDTPACLAGACRIFLEVPHVLPANSHYETPAKLCALFAKIRKKVDPSLAYYGLCIDTAHLWSCGADISSYEKAAAWLEGLDACREAVPPAALMFHLNDARDPLGSGLDEHEPLFQGAIWYDFREAPEASGLAAFVDYARRHGIPTVLERKAKKDDARGPALSAREAIGADLDALGRLLRGYN